MALLWHPARTFSGRHIFSRTCLVSETDFFRFTPVYIPCKHAQKCCWAKPLTLVRHQIHSIASSLVLNYLTLKLTNRLSLDITVYRHVLKSVFTCVFGFPFVGSAPVTPCPIVDIFSRDFTAYFSSVLSIRFQTDFWNLERKVFSFCL